MDGPGLSSRPVTVHALGRALRATHVMVLAREHELCLEMLDFPVTVRSIWLARHAACENCGVNARLSCQR
jgi:hypothetical protein